MAEDGAGKMERCWKIGRNFWRKPTENWKKGSEVCWRGFFFFEKGVIGSKDGRLFFVFFGRIADDVVKGREAEKEENVVMRLVEGEE